MGDSLEVVKVISIPAIISLTLFLTINYLLRPAIRRYKERYEQYLPLHSLSSSLTQRTKSLKSRIGERIMSYILPRLHINAGVDRRASLGDGEELFLGPDESEDMIGFDFRDLERRREQLRRDVGNMEGAREEGPEDYGEVR